MAQTEQPLSLLPALAAAIAEWFPELEGRALSVSEVDPFDNKSHVPRLPVAVVGLVGEEGTQAPNGGGAVTIEDDILVQFIFPPAKYQRNDGKDTPFYAFYDYEPLRDRLLYQLRNWRTPRGGGVQYRSLDVESDPFAVYVAFRLRTSERWCWSPPEDDPCGPELTSKVDVKVNLCAPSGKC